MAIGKVEIAEAVKRRKISQIQFVGFATTRGNIKSEYASLTDDATVALDVPYKVEIG